MQINKCFASWCRVTAASEMHRYISWTQVWASIHCLSAATFRAKKNNRPTDQWGQGVFSDPMLWECNSTNNAWLLFLTWPSNDHHRSDKAKRDAPSTRRGVQVAVWRVTLSWLICELTVISFEGFVKEGTHKTIIGLNLLRFYPLPDHGRSSSSSICPDNLLGKRVAADNRKC